jgi:hypothetical protein
MNVGLHVNGLIWVHKRDIWTDCFKITKNEIEEKVDGNR